jgi:ElaB/YqjD/DUF883 family membrane-anchored ribosome-binding protein
MSNTTSTTKTVKDAAESIGDQFTSDMETLKSDFKQLRSDVTGLLSHAADAGAQGVGSVRDKAYEAVDDLTDRVHDLRKMGAKQLKHVGREIGEYPMTTALIAFGVGFIAAKLISRS